MISLEKKFKKAEKIIDEIGADENKYEWGLEFNLV